MDLNPGIVNIYGPGESGKSNLVKYMLARPEYSRHIVFDPMKEYDPDRYNVFRPTHTQYDKGNAELNMFLKEVLDWPREIRPRYIVIDEAANYVPGGNKPVGEQVSKLAFHNTHIAPGITLITANRHPTDLNTTIREMYSDMFVFDYRGSAAKRALRDLSEGLPELIDDHTEQHEFVHVNPQGDKRIFKPVPDMGDYERL